MLSKKIEMVGILLMGLLATAASASGQLQEINGQLVYRDAERATAARTEPSTTETLTGVTQYLMIGGDEFRPGRLPADYVSSLGQGGACILSGWNALTAGVHLPQGAAITGFKVFFENGAGSDLLVDLQGHVPSGGYYFIIASLNASGIIGLGNKSTTAILSGPVDNTVYSYRLRAYSSSWNCNMRVMGALITYMI